MSFDRQAFMDLVENDKVLANTLLELFMNDWPVIYSQLEKAVDNNQFSEVEKLAHRIKGTVSNFFAAEAGQAAALIEECGRHQKANDLQNQLAELKRLLLTLQKELEVFHVSL